MAMKKCADQHCEETFEAKGARKFCALHAGVKKKPASKKPKKVTASEPGAEENFVVSLDLSEKQLDRIWAGASIEEKGLGIQTILDYTREAEQ
jgi:hypothetical protein